jgi:hypothetical protein
MENKKFWTLHPDGTEVLRDLKKETDIVWILDCDEFYTEYDIENILNKTIEDIETPIILGNVKILPYSYHRCWEDGEMKYVYHAGGSTPTKFERIKRILKK